MYDLLKYLIASWANEPLLNPTKPIRRLGITWASVTSKRAEKCFRSSSPVRVGGSPETKTLVLSMMSVYRFTSLLVKSTENYENTGKCRRKKGWSFFNFFRNRCQAVGPCTEVLVFIWQNNGEASSYINQTIRTGVRDILPSTAQIFSEIPIAEPVTESWSAHILSKWKRNRNKNLKVLPTNPSNQNKTNRIELVDSATMVAFHSLTVNIPPAAQIKSADMVRDLFFMSVWASLTLRVANGRCREMKTERGYATRMHRSWYAHLGPIKLRRMRFRGRERVC